MSHQCWDPKQYHLFEKERNQPFYDLLALIQKKPQMQVVDLGCGTGNLTKVLHNHLAAATTLGIDSSPQMLQQAQQHKTSGLDFELIDVNAFHPSKKLDLIFSNACLQWLPDHDVLFKRLRSYLAPLGQLAVQMPANYDFPSHTIAREIAQEKRFAQAGVVPLTPTILSAENYAQLFFDMGCKEQSVRLQVYPLVLDSVDALIEWVKGSLLTYYQSHLSPELFAEFVATYRRRLQEHFGAQTPLFVPFKRLLIWGSFF